jgi:hypothetical protein
MTQYGRDRRRGLTQDEMVTLFTRADGKCQRCECELDSTWHQAHLTPWSGGGATSLANMEAWCAQCNLQIGVEDVGDRSTVQLREWQSEALPVVLDRIYQRGVATLNAAPGAGKTIFAGTVFQRLAEAGLVERLIVVVPNVALVEQWVRTMGALGIHLDSEPRNGFVELQALPPVMSPGSRLTAPWSFWTRFITSRIPRRGGPRRRPWSGSSVRSGARAC